MPYSRPTLTQLKALAVQDVNTAVGTGAALLRRAVLRVLAMVQAGMSYLHYGYLDYIAREAVPFTATDEYLEGWAALKGVVRKAATKSSGVARFPGTNGIVVPTGAHFSRNDGATFISTAGATVTSGYVLVPATADVAGADGDTESGAMIVISSPVAGVQSTGLVSSAFVGGADAESDAELRTRMLLSYQTQPQGGAQGDYVVWSEAVPGVTRAWCERNGMGPGTVIVRIMMDDAEAAYAGVPQGTDGTATAEVRGFGAATGDQLTVANALWPLAPVTSLVYVVAPVLQPVPLRIVGVPAGLEAQVTASLKAAFFAEAIPGGPVRIKTLWAAVADGAGDVDFEILSADGISDPPVDVQADDHGKMLVLGTITWT